MRIDLAAGALLSLPLLASGQTQCPPSPAICEISVPNVSFGRIVPSMVTTTTLATFTLTVTCNRTTSAPVPIVIQLQLEGLTAEAVREAQGPAGTMQYGLFLDPSQTRPWGNGSGNTYAISDAFVLASGDLAITRSYYLYGRANADSSLGVGQYTDAITANLRYALTCQSDLELGLPRKP